MTTIDGTVFDDRVDECPDCGCECNFCRDFDCQTCDCCDQD